MTRARTGDQRRAELEFHASGFLVKVEGSWTATALAQFRHFLNLRRLSPSTLELKDSLIEAQIRRRQKPFVSLPRQALLQQDRVRYIRWCARSSPLRARIADIEDWLSGTLQASTDRVASSWRTK
jgi:hypothetical protein